MSQHYAILLLGSNKGNTKKNLEIAFEKLEQNGCIITKKSFFLMTEPIEFVSCNIFCNIATSIIVEFSPIKLLHIIKQIEVEMGRTHDSIELGVYEDRIIDIDIVTFDNVSYISKKLKIPHFKHLFEREFSKKLINNLGLNQKT